MKRFVVLNKKVGETPLSAITKWRQANPEYASLAASYAGRLDPMASGKLLVLLGEECKRQRAYTRLDKEYEVEIVLDVESDTGDILGLVSSGETQTTVTEGEVSAALRKERGIFSHAYPVYSSKTVAGKPLFLYALEGTLATIAIPKHREEFYRLDLLGLTSVSSAELKELVTAKLSLAPRTTEPSKKLGEDFRIDAVQASWHKVFGQDERTFSVLRLRVACASGAYMRTLAGRIGTDLGTTALALSIVRTKIGRYVNVLGRYGFWVTTY